MSAYQKFITFVPKARLNPSRLLITEKTKEILLNGNPMEFKLPDFDETYFVVLEVDLFKDLIAELMGVYKKYEKNTVEEILKSNNFDIDEDVDTILAITRVVRNRFENITGVDYE